MLFRYKSREVGEGLGSGGGGGRGVVKRGIAHCEVESWGGEEGEGEEWGGGVCGNQVDPGVEGVEA